MRELTTSLRFLALRALAVSVAMIVALGLGVIVAQEERDASVPLNIPKEERDRPNPVPANEESVEYGKLIFSSQCVMCHGKLGAGDGDLVPRLGLKLSDFTTDEKLKARTDGELFYILSQGHGSMPAQGERWSEKVRWDLVNYVRTLQK